MSYLAKNWKTTLAGVVGIAGIVVGTWFPEYGPQLTKATVVLTSLGLIAAKDGNKTGV